MLLSILKMFLYLYISIFDIIRINIRIIKQIILALISYDSKIAIIHYCLTLAMQNQDNKDIEQIQNTFFAIKNCTSLQKKKTLVEKIYSLIKIYQKKVDEMELGYKRNQKSKQIEKLKDQIKTIYKKTEADIALANKVQSLTQSIRLSCNRESFLPNKQQINQQNDQPAILDSKQIDMKKKNKPKIIDNEIQPKQRYQSPEDTKKQEIAEKPFEEIYDYNPTLTPQQNLLRSITWMEVRESKLFYSKTKIQQLATQMQQIHDVNQQLKKLVDQQGVKLDIITSNLESAEQNTKQARNQILKANEYHGGDHVQFNNQGELIWQNGKRVPAKQQKQSQPIKRIQLNFSQIKSGMILRAKLRSGFAEFFFGFKSFFSKIFGRRSKA